MNGRTRTAEREGFEVPVRVRLIESDLDQLDFTFSQALKDTQRELASMRKALVGILVSVTTASVMLAINILASR